jgi:heat shock protein HslJ
MSILVLTLPVSKVVVDQERVVITASVTNNGSVAARIVLGVLPASSPVAGADPSPAIAWTKVDQPLRELRAGATEQFTVTFTRPTGVAAGSYPVRFIAYLADGAPEESSDQAHQVEVVIPAVPVPPTPPKPKWWLYAVAAALVAIVAGVAFVLLNNAGGECGGAPCSTPSAPTTAPPPVPIEDVIWTLTDFQENATVSPWQPTPKRITISFTTTDMHGSAGCNSYSGVWGRTGNEISVKIGAVTLIGCAPLPASQEQRFLQILRDVKAISGSGSTMQLTTADGRALIFKR